MDKKQTNLEQMKGKNPFRMPDGYMEGLTSQIMSQLPEKPKVEEARRVSFSERVRPWLYLAAVFAGLGLFFDVMIGFNQSDENGNRMDSLLVRSEKAANLSTFSASDLISEEDAEYLDYIESRYASFILEEEMAGVE